MKITATLKSVNLVAEGLSSLHFSTPDGPLIVSAPVAQVLALQQLLVGDAFDVEITHLGKPVPVEPQE